MKKQIFLSYAILSAALAAFTVTGARAQHMASLSNFKGVWAGVVTLGAGESFRYNLVIMEISDAGLCSLLNINEEATELERTLLGTDASQNNIREKNSMIYTFTNTGGVWSETQTYIMNYLAPGMLYCILGRQVNNARPDEENPDENNTWHYVMQGILYHYADRESLINGWDDFLKRYE